MSVYDSAARPHPFLEELLAAWRYRDAVLQLVSRDIKVRYKRSALGVAWTMITPLAMMVVLTFVFSHVFRISLPHYPVYVLSAIVLWNFFAQSTAAAMTHLLWGGSLLHRIYVPRTMFALSSVGTGLVNLLLSLFPLVLIMAVTSVPIRPALIWLPIPIVLTAVFSLGIGLLLSAVAISFPDVVDMYEIALSAWYFFTPIIYPIAILPDAFRGWISVNPMYHLVEVFRAPIYAGWAPGLESLVAATLASIAALGLGWAIFTAKADDIAYRV